TLLISWDGAPGIGDSLTFAVGDPFIKVAKPTTTACVGEVRQITWTQNIGATTYTVELDRDGNGTPDEAIGSVVSNDAAGVAIHTNWTVTAGSPDPATTAKVVVTSSGGVVGVSPAFKVQTCN